ncbi:MAG TPA: hypothetical protein VM939_03710 [Gemmatimonadaceae bacterium]|nr:hypothetical protein [Gemmatimonadaceae bacterium]
MGSSTFSLALVFLARVAAAQEPAPIQDTTAPPDTSEQRVIGQVVRPGETRMIPVPGVWVVLHRVGNDRAAPLDSIRADPKGGYSFRYRRTGDRNAIYFASALHGGIAYFTPPLHHALVKGEEAEIAVFDTTSRHVPISIRGHHVVVAAVDANSIRSITEVYELANDSSVTKVASNNSHSGAVWSAIVPSGARGFRITEGDVPAGAVKFSDGKASVFAPIAPGIKQVAFTYDVPASSFPLSVPIDRPTQVLEVLIEEPKGTVTGSSSLKEVEPVALERRTFRRFLASNVPANVVSVIDLPAAARTSVDRRYLALLTVIIGGAMVVALARALRRR